jgi:hypothetical protein
VLNGLLIPVAHWDRQDPDGWPERIRATAAFAMGMLTELEDLGAYHHVDLEAAAVTAAAAIPAGVTSGRAWAAPPGN